MYYGRLYAGCLKSPRGRRAASSGRRSLSEPESEDMTKSQIAAPATAPTGLPADLLQLMQLVLDRLAAGAKFDDVVDETGITARVTETIQAQARPAFLIIQEGGSSAELFVHVHSSQEEAEDDRIRCAEDAYRTSSVVEVSGALAAHGELFYGALEELLVAAQEIE